MRALNLKLLWFLVGLASLVGLVGYPICSLFLMNEAENRFGFWGRVLTGILALAGFLFVLLRYLFRLADFALARERDVARKKYRGIFRVIALPTEDPENIWQLQEIEVGDFGWESKPIWENGLIYLQGLTEDWGLVWRAGFRPEQIEFVGEKPVSQYDWPDFEYEGPKPSTCYHWQYSKPKRPCPFPVPKKTKHDRLMFPI
jgi:hypothetical protein